MVGHGGVAYMKIFSSTNKGDVTNFGSYSDKVKNKGLNTVDIM
jgi:hypothetical protein